MQPASARATYRSSSPLGPAMGTTVQQEPLPVAPEAMSDPNPATVPLPAQGGDVIQDPAVMLPDRSRLVQEDQGVRYVSGGVGEGEPAEIKAPSNQSNLRLLFAKLGGAYLSDVQVSIRVERGSTSLDARSDGPVFFAQLPAGTYRVEATPSGTPDRIPPSQAVQIAGSGRSRPDCYWK